ncbi:DUF1493 family protein [Bacteroides faecalis]|uniref:Acyl carrier protein n=1 Tax=Bacteroides faecalis TaxID=2447885 RepID=A0A401LP83_9BACE|nr:DUF1493 family protein [Bacteroides faecalis]GCB33271.1 hypothetical protein KGMB02408_02160 [Bacteroides faecalis]
MKTMNKDDIWKQIILFVEEERWNGEFTHETDLVKDLKLKGDDAYEFICLFGKKFNINISEFDFEEYFDSEGDWILPMILDLLLKRKKKIKKKITLGDLERGVKEGKLI